MAGPTHYETLGVAPTADVLAVRAAYLAKAREVHPDRHSGAPAAARARSARAMQQVNEAWAVLGNPVLRSRYDSDLAYAAGRAGSAGGAAPRPSTSHAPPSGAASRPSARPVPSEDSRGTTFVEAGVGVRVVKVVAMLALVGFLVGLAVYLVATSISSKVSGSTDDDAGLAVGDCVQITATLREVDCREPHDGVVSVIIGFGQTCPTGAGQVPVDPARIACVSPR